MFAKSQNKERRPAGVSRRRKRQFGLRAAGRPPRDVGPVAAGGAGGRRESAARRAQIQSYSSATTEGPAQRLLPTRCIGSRWSGSRRSTRGNAQSAAFVPTDPLLCKAVAFDQLGQQVGSPDCQPIYGVPGEDINVAPVWNDGYTRRGRRRSRSSTPASTDHPDLAANINLALQFNVLTRSTRRNRQSRPRGSAPAHGTAVAGLIAAVANNGLGGVGVAPGVTIVPIRLIDAVEPRP